MCSTKLKKVREFLTSLRALSPRSLTKVFRPALAVIQILLLIMSHPPVCTTPFIITTHIESFKQLRLARACSAQPQSISYDTVHQHLTEFLRKRDLLTSRDP